MAVCLINTGAYIQLNRSLAALNGSRPFSVTCSQHYTGAYRDGQMKTWNPNCSLSMSLYLDFLFIPGNGPAGSCLTHKDWEE